MRWSNSSRRKTYRNRDELQTAGIQAHGRLIEAMAHQLMGFEILLRFLVDKEQLTEEESTAMLKEYRTLLLQNAAEQAVRIRQNDPCQVFLEKLSILMDTGQKRSIPQYVAHEAEELERLVKNGFGEDAETPFQEYAEKWLERQVKYAPGTLGNYRRMLDVVYPYIGAIPLCKLRPIALESPGNLQFDFQG